MATDRTPSQDLASEIQQLKDEVHELKTKLAKLDLDLALATARKEALDEARKSEGPPGLEPRATSGAPVRR